MTDKSLIEICKKKLAEQFRLDPDALSERDFEFLHQQILEKVKVDISTATLRRIWLNMHQTVPQIKTLDALARVLGYQGWHDFKMNHSEGHDAKPREFTWFLVAASISVIALVSWIFISNNSGSLPPVTLEPEKRTHHGVPATIGFHYQIPGELHEKIEIELSWNPFERTPLDAKNSFYTGTYFYPDYHQAKLLGKDEQILVSKNIHITTDGWHGLIMKTGFDPNPIYLDRDDFRLNEGLSVTESLATKYQVRQDTPYFPIFTLSDSALDSISGDDFFLKFNLRLLNSQVNMNCRTCDLLVKGEWENMRIPISQQGCYGVTTLSLSEKTLTGKTNDLSRLSADLAAWQEVKISNRDNQLTISVGNNDPYTLRYENKLGPLKVVKFVLLGPGVISDFTLESPSD